MKFSLVYLYGFLLLALHTSCFTIILNCQAGTPEAAEAFSQGLQSLLENFGAIWICGRRHLASVSSRDQFRYNDCIASLNLFDHERVEVRQFEADVFSSITAFKRQVESMADVVCASSNSLFPGSTASTSSSVTLSREYINYEDENEYNNAPAESVEPVETVNYAPAVESVDYAPATESVNYVPAAESAYSAPAVELAYADAPATLGPEPTAELEDYDYYSDDESDPVNPPNKYITITLYACFVVGIIITIIVSYFLFCRADSTTDNIETETNSEADVKDDPCLNSSQQDIPTAQDQIQSPSRHQYQSYQSAYYTYQPNQMYAYPQPGQNGFGYPQPGYQAYYQGYYQPYTNQSYQTNLNIKTDILNNK